MAKEKLDIMGKLGSINAFSFVLKALIPQGENLANWVIREGEGKVSEWLEGQFAERWDEGALKAIAKDMDEDGFTLGKMTKREVIRDAQFRLWRLIFKFQGGGKVADAFRDTHEFKVVPIVEKQVETTTPMVEMLQAVVKAELDLTF